MISEEPTWILKPNKTYPKLSGSLEAEVVIVGAGLAGIFNAYLLSKAGLKIVVLEKEEQILQSTTLYTTAFVTQILDSSYSELIKLFGKRKAKLAWQSGHDAIALIADIIKQENIDCEFKTVPIRIYAKDPGELEDLQEESEALRESGFEAELKTDTTKLNFKNSGFLEIPGQAMFHPTKFAQALAEAAETAGAQIFTSSEVTDIENQTAKTGGGQVTAKDILIATYKPITNQGTRFKKGMYVSYVHELEIPQGMIPEGLYVDMENPYHYFRVDSLENFDRMIAGGEDHRQDVKIDPAKNFSALGEHFKNILGSMEYKITRQWKGRILEPSDGLALIGKIKPHTFVATAFSGNGMTYSALSAMIVRDSILGQTNPYIKLFSPKRIPSPKQLFLKARDYIGEFFGGALKNFFHKK
jgi:glycine/D-amino acid oxidase-like deaminating enzyme